LRLLLDAGADLELRSSDDCQITPIFYAMKDYCLKSLKMVVKEKGAKVLVAKDRHGIYPLHYAIHSGAIAVIKWMLQEEKIDEEIPVNETPNPRWIALHLAAQKPEILQILVK